MTVVLLVFPDPFGPDFDTANPIPMKMMAAAANPAITAARTGLRFASSFIVTPLVYGGPAKWLR
jgi:hypothetical protein